MNYIDTLKSKLVRKEADMPMHIHCRRHGQRRTSLTHLLEAKWILARRLSVLARSTVCQVAATGRPRNRHRKTEREKETEHAVVAVHVCVLFVCVWTLDHFCARLLYDSVLGI